MSLHSAMSSPQAAPRFVTRLARDSRDVRAAQALRYRVFVEELGGDGPLVDYAVGLERDTFDTHAEQLILLDVNRAEGDQVVGVYRLMDAEGAAAAGQFYSETEYNLNVLRASGRPLLELGRSCLHPDYRGGAAMMHLWQALADEVTARGVEVLFGVASFHGTDLDSLAQPLAVLQRDHLAPEDLRVRSRAVAPVPNVAKINKVAAMRQVPALIKAYLRLGGYVGEGAFVDRAFNTTDVCLVLDTARMTARQKAPYAPRGGGRT